MDLNNIELTEYQKEKLDRISSSESFIDYYVIRVNSIEETIIENKVRLNLPSFPNLSFEYANVTGKRGGDFSWYGVTTDKEVGTLLYVDKAKKTYGQIRYKQEVWEFMELGGGLHVLYRLSEEVLNATCSVDDKTPSNVNKPQFKSKSSRSVECPERAVVRILVLYTPSAEQSVPDIESIANLSMIQLEQALNNSQVDSNKLSVELADILPINFNETNLIYNDRDALVNSTVAQNLRQTNQADLVLMLTDNSYSSSAGIAAQILADFSTGYAIAVASSATANLTFAHEIGHLFGGRHNNDPNGTIEHGYVMSPTRGTIMAVRSAINGGGNRILHFSNDTGWFNGQSTGTTSYNDNQREFENNGLYLASFYPNSIPQLNAYINGPYSICENTSGIFTAMVECGEPSYSYKWERSTDGVNWTTVGTAYTYNYYQPPGMNGNFNFTLRLTVTDDLNTIVTSYQTITAVDPVSSDFLCAPGDEDDPALLNSFTAYPNPTSANQTLGLVFEEELKKNPIQINLLDQYGRTIQTKEVKQTTSHKEQFSLGQQFSAGLFYLQVYFDDGSTESQPILIE